jgi:ribosome-associated translation inhibitor RaiA
MNIVLHAHHAHVPEPLLRRAEAAVARLGARVPRATNAVVRFAEDGSVRRVEVTARVPRRTPMVAVGEARAWEVAIAEALDRFEGLVSRVRAVRDRRVQAAQRGAEARRLAGLPPASQA